MIQGRYAQQVKSIDTRQGEHTRVLGGGADDVVISQGLSIITIATGRLVTNMFFGRGRRSPVGSDRWNAAFQQNQSRI